MKHVALLLPVLLLVACADSGPEADAPATESVAVEPGDAPQSPLNEPALAGASMSEPASERLGAPMPADMDADGKVLITVDRLIPEPEACLLMMDVVNGTDETVTAGLFTFDVTGNGEEAGANMFPQTADPDSVQTAQIVLQGADCENALSIEGGQINCKITDTGESCIDAIELRDGAVEFSVND